MFHMASFFTISLLLICFFTSPLLCNATYHAHQNYYEAQPPTTTSLPFSSSSFPFFDAGGTPSGGSKPSLCGITAIATIVIVGTLVVHILLSSIYLMYRYLTVIYTQIYKFLLRNKQKAINLNCSVTNIKDCSGAIKMKITGLFCFVLVLQMSSSCYATRKTSMETHMSGVDSYLSRLNKTPLKSIKSPDGDIIDCVDIYKQPALDHPLLRDHSIQMRPNYYPEEFSFERNLSGNAMFENHDTGDFETMALQLWQKNGRCPEGTIPIRRTTKKDLLRADSIERFGKKSPGSLPMSRSVIHDIDNRNNHEHAICFVGGDKYFGTNATINVWQPQIELPNEFSLSQIWILGGDFGPDTNSIEVGWQAYPDLYGDNKTRLFTYWTSDNYLSTGCYNLLCSGFVQTNKNVVLGGATAPVSSYSGPQFVIHVIVRKEPNDGNWWLRIGNYSEIGYWPATLFTHLKYSSNVIQWGGGITNLKPNGMHTTTQMGSGHFAEEGFAKASFFKSLQVVDDSNTMRDVEGLQTHINGPTGCYNVNILNDGTDFFYGGPGRNENCP